LIFRNRPAPGSGSNTRQILSAEGDMYKRILLPTDGSELSERAVREGVRFAKSIGAQVTALHVTPPFYPAGLNPGAFTAQAEEHARQAKESTGRALGFAERAAREAGVQCSTLHKEGGGPWEEIINAAADQECDLIFMASHGRRGVAALVLGSETNKVLTHSTIPVLVTR
jgi:nucleotide-binding universal stress UspA family protein